MKNKIKFEGSFLLALMTNGERRMVNGKRQTVQGTWQCRQFKKIGKRHRRGLRELRMENGEL